MRLGNGREGVEKLTVIAINHDCAVGDRAKLGEEIYQFGLACRNRYSTDKDFPIQIEIKWVSITKHKMVVGGKKGKL